MDRRRFRHVFRGRPWKRDFRRRCIGGSISLSVEAVNGETHCYGKKASELQKDIVINGDEISGTLHPIDDYSEAFPDESEKTGHFLALAFTIGEGTTVKTRVIGGRNKDVDVTKDKYCVYRIADKDTQQIQVTTEKGEMAAVKTYSLKKLVLQ